VIPAVSLTVSLSPAAWAYAQGVAEARQRFATDRGRLERPHPDGQSGDQCHIEGAVAEVALAGATQFEYTGNLGDFTAADVGHLEIRTTDHPRGRLILQKRDADAAVFLFARIWWQHPKPPLVQLVGWIHGRDGKQPAYWWDAGQGPDRLAYYVPDHKLHPFRIATPA
jgi:hypothetical protein